MVKPQPEIEENAEELGKQKQKELVGQSVRALKWFFGWLPKGITSQFDKINDLLIGEDMMDDDDLEIKDQSQMPLTLSPR